MDRLFLVVTEVKDQQVPMLMPTLEPPAEVTEDLAVMELFSEDPAVTELFSEDPAVMELFLEDMVVDLLVLMPMPMLEPVAEVTELFSEDLVATELFSEDPVVMELFLEDLEITVPVVMDKAARLDRILVDMAVDLLVLMLMPMLMLEPVAEVTDLFSEDLAITEMSSEVMELLEDLEVSEVLAKVAVDMAEALLVLMPMLLLMLEVQAMFLVDMEMALKEVQVMEDLVKVDSAGQPEEVHLYFTDKSVLRNPLRLTIIFKIYT